MTSTTQTNAIAENAATPPASEFSSFLPRLAERFGDKLAVCLSGGDPSERYSYAELDSRSLAFARYLSALGVGDGQRVAILAESRPRWLIAFFGAIRSGALALPLDTRLGTSELKSIMDDAEPAALVLTADSLQCGQELARHSGLEHVISLEAPGRIEGLPSIDELEGPATELPGRAEHEPVVLTYTSGTMGIAKGVLTTAGNLQYQVHSLVDVMQSDESVVLVSILPLSHLFELTAGLLGPLYCGGRICYVHSLMPHEITRAMAEEKVTCMITVPLFLKLLRNGIEREVAVSSPIRRLSFRAAFSVARILPMALRRRLFGALHSRFGSKLEYFISGGAPLETEVQRFFHRLGIPVCEGYGMAEASPVISFSTPRQLREGTVGKPMPGLSVRIDERGDGRGEILTRGPHVMSGYFRQPELTAEMIDPEGWLHTGDIGYLDDDGFLTISGRSKNVIVLGSGMKVHPEQLEQTLFNHADFADGCVLGVVSKSGITADTEEVCAIFVPSEAAIEQHSADELEQALKLRVKELAEQLAPWERPSRIHMRRSPLPRTSTRKIKRLEVARWVEQQDLSS